MILAEVVADFRNKDVPIITPLVAAHAIPADTAILTIWIAISFPRNLMRSIFLSDKSFGQTPRISEYNSTALFFPLTELI